MKCLRFYFGVERGGVLSQLHLQGAISLHVTSAGVVTRQLREAIGFNGQDGGGHTIMCRELKGTNLHTFVGMVGYCSKDVGLAHFTHFFAGVTQQDIDAGHELYIQFGSSEEMKNRVILNSSNILTRAAVFNKYKCRHPIGMSFHNVLVEMHRTGKYIPDAKWLVPVAGKGMQYSRAEAAWRMFLLPEKVTRGDVSLVYFSHADCLRLCSSWAIPKASTGGMVKCP